MWMKEVKGKRPIDLYHDFLPSITEIVQGLQEFIFHMVDETMKGKFDAVMIQDTKNSYAEVFTQLLKFIEIPGKDKPLKLGDHSDLDLHNPNSVVVAFLCYLYSIEPPFYFYVNQACMQRDKSMLKSLGPYATAIYFML